MAANYWRAIVVLALVLAPVAPVGAVETDRTRLSDTSRGGDWAAFGRTFGEQHFSPLHEITDKNIAKLGLSWSLDIPEGNAVTAPLVVEGILYFTTGLSVVRAVDAKTGKVLWTYDFKVPETGSPKLRVSWGARGLGYWNGKIFAATVDGRLSALDAKTGGLVWTTMTLDKDDYSFISGAPRVFGGKVIIGFGGAEYDNVRGYVTTYDAETGKQLWRFYTVPGNPADGFENEAMAMAARTWSGEWWKYGGGGNAWNAFTYDAESNTVYVGTGNGAPWNQKIRSEGKGDNLFLCSIVALDADTGAYKWHYQINPGESWDYNAAMDMELADLNIDGRIRKVLMTAPKNGFFYVIDRTDGKLISAKPFAKVTWATGIDPATGRPMEVPEARYPNGISFRMSPGPVGAHNWQPMSFNPKTGIVYIPTISQSAIYSDKGLSREYVRRKGIGLDNAVNVSLPDAAGDPDEGTSGLLAWNVMTQTPVWKIPTPGIWNGGILATAGNLVFQGQIDRVFNAYAADTGKRLWSFAAQAPVIAPPISYRVGGRQYVTVITGIAGSGVMDSGPAQPFNLDYHVIPRRVLTFALGGKEILPKAEVEKLRPLDDPTFKVDDASAERGAKVFNSYCFPCHGLGARAAGFAPDLRASPIPQSEESFNAVVRDGALKQNGMPRFDQFSDGERNDIRQYLRTEGRKLAPTN